MLKPCWQAQCACHPAARTSQPAPRCLEDLIRLAPAASLDADIETLVLLGTQFEDALVTTRNAAAVISGRGGYARVQSLENDFNVNALRANLRFFRAASLRVVRCSAEPLLEHPASLVAVDAAGEVHHRVQYVSEYDQRVAGSLSEGQRSLPAATDERAAKNVVQLNAVRMARDHWDRSTAADHLNDFLMHRGRARRVCLPHLGQEKAWRTALPYLAPLLQNLSHRGTNFTRIVCAEGLIQAQAGQVAQFSKQGDIVMMEHPSSSFALDLGQVSELWVTASRLHWQIEAYDAAGQAVAVFCAPPLSCGTDWREALLSLPRIG